MTTAEHQGRARGLYDEQLQRQKQEKLLFHKAVPATGAGSRAVMPVEKEGSQS